MKKGQPARLGRAVHVEGTACIEALRQEADLGVSEENKFGEVGRSRSSRILYSKEFGMSF